MSISSNKDSLKDFIYFIQNNELPKKLTEADQSLSSFLQDQVAISNFIAKNPLPIANIESINSSKSDTDELLNTEIQVNFFSQKTNNEQ